MNTLYAPDFTKLKVVCQKCGETGTVDASKKIVDREYLLKLREEWLHTWPHPQPTEYWLCRSCGGL